MSGKCVRIYTLTDKNITHYLQLFFSPLITLLHQDENDFKVSKYTLAYRFTGYNLTQLNN